MDLFIQYEYNVYYYKLFMGQINTILLKKVSWFPQKYQWKQLCCIQLILNVSWATNKQIRMISEGSLKTGVNYILKYIKIENRFKIVKQYLTFTVFW